MAIERKSVAFRVDASYAIGTGHVTRCLALAEELKNSGTEAVFVCRPHEGHLSALIEERGFTVLGLPPPSEHWASTEQEPAHAAWLGADWQTDADETLRVLDTVRPDWLIVDHYAIDARWEGRLRPAVDSIVVIDDLADRAHACDTLMDQSLVTRAHERYVDRVPESATILLGPAYALLQAQYRRHRAHATTRSGKVSRVLVSFGGVDRHGLTRATVDALLAIRDKDFKADIVLAAGSADYTLVQRAIAGRSNFRLHDRVTSLAPMMLAADLMVGAGGTTSWERLCLGLPAIIVTVASNQHPVAEELSRRGLVRWLGDADPTTASRLRSALTDIFATGLDPDWSERCFEVVDGRGTTRVCAVLSAHRDMPLFVRTAEPRDEGLLLEWSNDAETRRNAFNPKPISPAEHHAWFNKRLGRQDDCALYVVQSESGVPVGQVRFEKQEDRWEISYAVAPDFRGFGLGRPLLARAIEHLRIGRPDITLFGQVKPQNAASQKIFKALEFAQRKAEPDRFIFERSFKE